MSHGRADPLAQPGPSPSGVTSASSTSVDGSASTANDSVTSSATNEPTDASTATEVREGPTLFADPSAALPGAAVTIRGSGWNPQAGPVEIHAGKDLGTHIPAPLSTAVVNPDGTFVAPQFAVPDAPPGPLVLYVYQADFFRAAVARTVVFEVRLQVLATTSRTPASGSSRKVAPASVAASARSSAPSSASVLRTVTTGPVTRLLDRSSRSTDHSTLWLAGLLLASAAALGAVSVALARRHRTRSPRHAGRHLDIRVTSDDGPAPHLAVSERSDTPRRDLQLELQLTSTAGVSREEPE